MPATIPSILWTLRKGELQVTMQFAEIAPNIGGMHFVRTRICEGNLGLRNVTMPVSVVKDAVNHR
jgi:hypothetical protein